MAAWLEMRAKRNVATPDWPIWRGRHLYQATQTNRPLRLMSLVGALCVLLCAVLAARLKMMA